MGFLFFNKVVKVMSFKLSDYLAAVKLILSSILQLFSFAKGRLSINVFMGVLPGNVFPYVVFEYFF